MNVSENVKNKIALYIDNSPESISPEDSIESLGIDSLDKAEIIVELEKEYDITVPDYEFVSIITIQDIINVINEKI